MEPIDLAREWSMPRSLQPAWKAGLSPMLMCEETEAHRDDEETGDQRQPERALQWGAGIGGSLACD
jgi:hypothetical protein